MPFSCRYHSETFSEFTTTLQVSPILFIRSTKMLHLQWDSSPKDDKRFNLLLAMSEEKMSNNLLWTLLVGDGEKLLDMQVSTEVCNENGKGNCSGCWSLFGAVQDWHERVGCLEHYIRFCRFLIAIKIVNHRSKCNNFHDITQIYLRHFHTFILELPPFSLLGIVLWQL